MSIFRFNVAARFVLILSIGLLFQTVISIVSLIDWKQSMLEGRTSEVRHLLEVAYSTVDFYHQQELQGLMSDEKAREAARKAVRAMHYDGQNYFFIWDLNGNSIVHGGNAGYEGKNYLNGSEAEQSPAVSGMVQQLVNVARGPAKEGSVMLKTPKAGQTVPLDQISYSRLFEPWGWSIGTAAYIDDIDAAFKKRGRQLLWTLLALMLLASAVTYYVAHDLVMAMRRLVQRINNLTTGELISAIHDTDRNDEVGVMARAVLALRDTCKEVSELKLDHLTGLPTRKLLMDRISQSKVRTARSNRYNALMLLNLDKFKPLNDTHGHEAGDKLLKEVALRLGQIVRESDTVARLGGDEFVVLLADLSDDEQRARLIAGKIGEKILIALNQQYQLGHIAHHCSASVGVTLYQGKSVPAEDLLKQADIAMYKSKVAGSDVCHFFEDGSQAHSAEQLNFDKELSLAIAQNQFVMYYQPQMGMDGKVTGCEALIRWQHPQRGLLHPHEFFPQAEKKGLATPLGNIALELACAQIARWSSHAALADLNISVNIGANHFRRAEFVEHLLSIIQRTHIYPGRLALELPEQVLANNIAIVIEKMTAIRNLGVRFAIDDFGMSYSPLSHLAQLPIQEIKICKDMVQQVFADAGSLTTPRMLLAMAQNLGLHTVAVGVETTAQQACLMQAGCDGLQGYLYSEPLSSEEFERFLTA